MRFENNGGTFRTLVGSIDLPGKSIVLGIVRRLRTMKTMAIYLVSLLPPGVRKYLTFKIVHLVIIIIIIKIYTAQNYNEISQHFWEVRSKTEITENAEELQNAFNGH